MIPASFLGWGGIVRADDGTALFLALKLVRKWEGLALRPYLCPAGKPTVGYGHVILPAEVHLHAGVTACEAESLLLRDMSWALFAVRQVGRVLLPGQLAALASLVFNIGAAAWNGSEIQRCVRAGDFVEAAGQFGRWNKAGGAVVSGLVARRADELKVFGGDYGLVEKQGA